LQDQQKWNQRNSSERDQPGETQAKQRGCNPQ
jgi:hypothetical protein